VLLYREQWLAAARKVFEGLDGANGLTSQKLLEVLREKIPSAEVDYAVEDALLDAGYKGVPSVFLNPTSYYCPCQGLLAIPAGYVCASLSLCLIVHALWTGHCLHRQQPDKSSSNLLS
jgi:hypothetical protein